MKAGITLKKIVSVIAGMVVIIAAILITPSCSSSNGSNKEFSYQKQLMYDVGNAAIDKGYELSYMEQIYKPVTMSDADGNTIIYNRYISTDPETIRNGTASFFTEVFDPATADSVTDTLVNDTPALLYEREGRSYLIWNPNENAIAMLDYDANAVSDAEIIKMAESV
jgi:hypothetical protein